MRDGNLTIPRRTPDGIPPGKGWLSGQREAAALVDAQAGAPFARLIENRPVPGIMDRSCVECAKKGLRLGRSPSVKQGVSALKKTQK